MQTFPREEYRGISPAPWRRTLGRGAACPSGISLRGKAGKYSIVAQTTMGTRPAAIVEEQKYVKHTLDYWLHK